MAVYIVTGKLGNGKSLVSVGRIQDKLLAGCIVATNLDINLTAMFGVNSKKCRVMRLPDKPVADDLFLIGNANLTYDENKNGLLVLDECGTWFNSRNWQDKSRKGVNDWFLHARKLGWDVIIIVQDISLIDSQAREAIAEHTVFCKRLDRLHIPFFGTIYKSFVGKPLRMPRVHVGRVVYGMSPLDPLSDRWVYRGNSLFKCYDTKQAFLAEYPHAVHSVLPPWYIKGRYLKPRDWRWYMRATKVWWKRFKSPVAMATGVLLGISVAAAAAFASTYHDLKVQTKMLSETNEKNKVLPDVKKEPGAADKFFERLKKLRISSSWVINGETFYQFRDDSNEKGPAYFNSQKLIESGVYVSGVYGCRASLTYENRSTTVYCL